AAAPCAAASPTPLEDLRQERRLDAGALVGHRDPCARLHALEADPDSPVRRAELDRIREEVPDDLLQPIGIREDRSRVWIEEGIHLDVLRIGQPLDGLDCRLDDGDRIDLPALDPELAGDDARHVEEVFDELREELRVPLDYLETACRAGRVLESDAQEARASEHGRERSAQ